MGSGVSPASRSPAIPHTQKRIIRMVATQRFLARISSLSTPILPTFRIDRNSSSVMLRRRRLQRYPDPANLLPNPLHHREILRSARSQKSGDMHDENRIDTCQIGCDPDERTISRNSGQRSAMKPESVRPINRARSLICGHCPIPSSAFFRAMALRGPSNSVFFAEKSLEWFGQCDRKFLPGEHL